MLPFSASLAVASRLDLPWVEPGARLFDWARHEGAVALISDGGPQGRYSYLMAEPDAGADLAPGDDASQRLRAATAFVATTQAADDLPPFSGGLIGIAGFEFGLRLEAMPRAPFRIEGGAAWPELMLRRYPAVLAFDHEIRTLTAIGRGSDATAAEAARDRLIALWRDTRDVIPPEGALLDGPLRLETPDPVHEDKVAAIVGQIHAGDLFQANLARGWTGRLREDVTPGGLLAALHARGPAPFGAYVGLGDRAIVSNSPECFIRLDRTGGMETRPIKGTRPRGRTKDEDMALAAELAASAKDRAENLMIVDLMRHDLAKVATIGSVRVTALNALESYANVHHLVSTVVAQLTAYKTAADLLLATLPPGSVSGAPKVQAMKVISAMEAARGPYCGALFAIDATGAMNSSVLIRTLACENSHGRWSIRAAAGGGIVADSDPVDERIETETKLSLIRRVLEGR